MTRSAVLSEILAVESVRTLDTNFLAIISLTN